ncbi:MAG: hypothetical protein U9N39_02105 [Campylobacterota bacterium]|nr:hypothetical protein [Campylobacterota bacterium]
MLIIASFLLSTSGCGYKKQPYHLEDAPDGDENVEFIIKKKSQTKLNKNSESCE